MAPTIRPFPLGIADAPPYLSSWSPEATFTNQEPPGMSADTAKLASL